MKKKHENPKSELIRHMISNTELSQKEVAEAIGCKYCTFLNKLTRGQFSFEDMLLIGEVCGYYFSIYNYCSDHQILDPEKFVGNDATSDVSIERRIYERKKAELEKMKLKFGFED